MAGSIGEILFFTVFDPQELYLFGEPSQLSRLSVYSIGFFLCWAFAAASSALTCFLQRGADGINGADVSAAPHERSGRRETPST